MRKSTLSIPTPPSTNPSSSGSRRSQSGSSESVSGLDELYHREPFREGAPGPLCYSPGITGAVLQSDQITADWQSRLWPTTSSILAARDVHPRSVGILHRRDQFRPESQPDVTVTIDAPHKHYKNNNWFLAISELRQFYSRVGYGDLIVEIADFEARNKRSWAIDFHAPIVREWPKIVELLLQELRDNTAAGVESIGCLRRGNAMPESQNPLTIILTAPEVYHLMRIKDKIREKLDNQGYWGIELEIVRDKICRRAADTSPDHHQMQAGMGVSLGAKGSLESGTLGGYLTLCDNAGQEVQVALTNYHVIRPGLPSERKTACDSHGIKPFEQGVTVIQPTLPDHEDYIKSLEEKLGDIQKDLPSEYALLDQLSMKIEMGVKQPRSDQKLKDIISSSETSVKKLQTMISNASAFFQQHAELGRIWAASGYRYSAENIALDWALILLNNDRSPGNPDVPKDRNGVPISGFLKPVGANPLSQKVWKKGRTTGLTRGIVNGLKFVTVEEGKDLPNTWVLVVVGTENNRFSDKGDSGAMVVTNGGEIIGLLHSGHQVQDLTYVTPYDVLVKDIEQVTKMEVVWT
ncbi:MAG: hypothetical protein M1840_009093 [Geoglossum simile]|nr:MAG: hypothetical protein M1840_009093 [Geoglossum simile]